MKTAKKFFGTMTLAVAMLLLLAPSANAQNDNGLIGKARGELSSCLVDYQGSDWEISGIVAVVNCVTTPCPVAHEVSIFACPDCNPNNPNDFCSRRPCIQIGTVSFDAQGHVLSSTSICD